MKRDRSSSIHIVSPYHEFEGVYDDAVSSYVGKVSQLFLCDSCLTLFSSSTCFAEHLKVCPNSFWIPGDEVYRSSEGRFVVFELDGRKSQSVFFARRLGILTKLFLLDKNTIDDVHFFSFFALFEVDDSGYHFAGYFSKEWKNSTNCINTLSCVMVLPPFRQKGYGQFLVQLSYSIARREQMIGTPERPLSKSGKRLFRKAWRVEILNALRRLTSSGSPVTLESICRISGLIVEDALVAIHDLGGLYTLGKQDPSFVFEGTIGNLGIGEEWGSHDEHLQWSSRI